MLLIGEYVTISKVGLSGSDIDGGVVVAEFLISKGKLGDDR